MVFSSGIFLFAFLPLFLTVYYLTPYRFKSITILIGSYVFYAWWRVDFVLLFAGVTLWNHMMAKMICRYDGTNLSKKILILGVAGNLLTLGFFKYFNFGVDSFNMALEAAGFNPISAMQIILPIGISFYIFQAISFLIDVYRKDAPPAKNFWDFAAFISLFPQLIAGPVLRYKDLAGQFENRVHNMEVFSEGAYRFMAGFAMKVLIADSVAPIADRVFALDNPTMAEAWLGAIAYTIQLFFDFAGYSSMAIGLGLMMGFRFIENFNNPYISKSITEFWQRWHISLSTWLKDYLYIPLGGNRKGKIRTYVNLLVTMVLGGLWHGANWTFVLWGAWHGVILAIERAVGIKKRESAAAMVKVCYIAFTMILVIIGWVMFRAESVSSALQIYEGMLGFNGFGMSDRIIVDITGFSLMVLVLAVAFTYIRPWFFEFREKAKDKVKKTKGYRIWWVELSVILLFILAVTRLAEQNYSPFLYFQF